MLMVCVAAPTESPGDDQEGVRGSARLEAGELEESQRTLLSVWCEDMTWLRDADGGGNKRGASLLWRRMPSCLYICSIHNLSEWGQACQSVQISAVLICMPLRYE